MDLEAVVSAVVREVQSHERVGPAAVQRAVRLCTAADQPPVAEIAEQLEVERRAGAEGEPLVERFVLNTRSGTYHRRVGAGVSSAAACGWSYGANPHAFVPDVTAGPKCRAQLCSRCWPSLRAVAQATGVINLLGPGPAAPLALPRPSSSSGAPPV